MSAVTVRSESEYEELLSQWADLEDGLAILLAHPRHVTEFASRVHQYERWLRELLAQDTDLGLYLLFQLAANTPVGYSTSHALACAVLCQLMSAELELAPDEADALVRAAFTMNIGMTALQDRLARQAEPLSPEQQATVRAHPRAGRELLQGLGVHDPLWLDVVEQHHAPQAGRLAQALQAVDRYAALISPRKSRAGRNAADSVRAVAGGTPDARDPVGQALARVVGQNPPGTLVRLDDGQVAVVLRRGAQPHRPDLAIVADARGHALTRPVLHRTGDGPRPFAFKALAGSTLRLRLNHFRVLQLTATP